MWIQHSWIKMLSFINLPWCWSFRGAWSCSSYKCNFERRIGPTLSWLSSPLLFAPKRSWSAGKRPGTNPTSSITTCKISTTNRISQNINFSQKHVQYWTGRHDLYNIKDFLLKKNHLLRIGIRKKAGVVCVVVFHQLEKAQKVKIATMTNIRPNKKM